MASNLAIKTFCILINSCAELFQVACLKIMTYWGFKQSRFQIVHSKHVFLYNYRTMLFSSCLTDNKNRSGCSNIPLSRMQMKPLSLSCFWIRVAVERILGLGNMMTCLQTVRLQDARTTKGNVQLSFYCCQILRTKFFLKNPMTIWRLFVYVLFTNYIISFMQEHGECNIGWTAPCASCTHNANENVR